MLRRSLLIAFLGLTTLAHGQAAGKFSFRTLCINYVDGISKLYLPDPQSGDKLEVPLFTEVYSLPAAGSSRDGKVTFLLSDEEPENGKNPAALAPVKLPASSKVLFLFLPNPGKEGQPYLPLALADDTGSFPLGSVRLVNLTPAELRFDLGEHAGAKGIRVKPGKIALVDGVKKVNHLNHYNAKVFYQLKPGEFAPFYNSRWRSVGAKRDLVVAYLDPVSKQPVVTLFEDVPPSDEPVAP